MENYLILVFIITQNKSYVHMLFVFTWRFIIIIQVVVGTTAVAQTHISLLSPLRLVFIHVIFPIGVDIHKK